MATGSQSDFINRLQAWLPSRWFPTQTVNADGSVPRIHAMLAGAAAVFAQVWTQLQYARAQMRLDTSTDGWLDLGIADYLGNDLLRNRGETDPAYWTRAQPQLLPKANTRTNIENALEAITTNVRMIEPFDPRDNMMLDVSFLDVDTETYPGNFSDQAARANGLVQCVLPSTIELGNNPGQVFLDAQFLDAGFLWQGEIGTEGGAGIVYALINRLKVFGTKVWVQFIPAPGTDNPFTLDSSLLGSTDVLT